MRWRAGLIWIVLCAALILSARPVMAQDASTPAPAPAPVPAPPSVSVPDSPAPLRAGDAFGEEVILGERTIIYFNGHGTWDKAFETISEAFGSLKQYLVKHDIKPNGPAMTIYIQTSDSGFDFRAALPIGEPPKNPPIGDIAIGQTPSGKALKFVHRGSFDALDTTYEAITNYLDERRLEARDVFIEEYAGDGLKNAEDRIVVNVYVPIKQ